MTAPAHRGSLVSINVGGPREVRWGGETVLTSIWKTPVAGPVRVRRLNLDGDKQSDLSVHGGRDKAVYAYPSEHYPRWRTELPGVDLPWGAFGENLSTQGMLEDEVYIGDRLRIGTAEFIVTQPRLPCFKLGIRFGDPMMVKRFLASGCSGFYLKVAKEGEVAAGDPIQVLLQRQDGMSVAEIAALHERQDAGPGELQKAIAQPDLAESWREHFRRRLAG